MSKAPICILISVLSISYPAVHGQGLEELIIPITGAELAEVNEQKEFSIREELYYSKAHRIVRINDGLLYDAERFTITLIGDVQLTVETTAVETGGLGAFAWHGLRVPPNKKREPIRLASGETLPEAEAEQLYEDIHGISIYVMEWDRNNESGEARPAMYRPKGVGFDRPTPEERIAADAWRGFQPNAFRTITARIAVMDSGKVFRIEPLDDSEYHVLFEEDSERMGSPIDGPYGPSSDDDYIEFLEALRQEEAARKEEAGEQ